jgi:hypothetical protein
MAAEYQRVLGLSHDRDDFSSDAMGGDQLNLQPYITLQLKKLGKC